MQEQHYKTILYFISAVILITLATQVYWNYKNYLAGEQQLINDVQVSLDNAVDNYYIDLAQSNTIGFSVSGESGELDLHFVDSVAGLIDHNIREQGDEKGIDSTMLQSLKELQISTEKLADSLKVKLSKDPHYLSNHSSELDNDDIFLNGDIVVLDSLANEGLESISIFKSNGNRHIEERFSTIQLNDSLKNGAVRWFMGDSTHRDNALAQLTSRVIFSISNDSLDVEKLDSFIDVELARKQIKVDYSVLYIDHKGTQEISNPAIDKESHLKTTSNSGYLPDDGILELSFDNVMVTILKKNLLGILLSFLLMGAVISSLLYMLKIIREQKELAEIKNDFISNITHELKTPIATIGVAMESIQHFNTTNDIEKTKKYVDMSSQQVQKLNIMVEKLLETATLDSEALNLNKEDCNIVDLLDGIHTKYSTMEKNKTITFDNLHDQIWVPIDAFHIENAVDNIIDNAIKYGGETIGIAIRKEKDHVEINISDSGHQLSKAQANQIFEKFYRVPKGNTHDVKGFGIGLYYTKTIIEKHNGTIAASTHPTIFKITLPYV